MRKAIELSEIPRDEVIYQLGLLQRSLLCELRSCAGSPTALQRERVAILEQELDTALNVIKANRGEIETIRGS